MSSCPFRYSFAAGGPYGSGCDLGWLGTRTICTCCPWRCEKPMLLLCRQTLLSPGVALRQLPCPCSHHGHPGMGLVKNRADSVNRGGSDVASKAGPGRARTTPARACTDSPHQGEPILSNNMHETGDQRQDHRDNRHGGDGANRVIPVPPNLAARVTLRQMREQAGISLEELASQVGVSTSTLRMFETGIPDLAPATYADTVGALAVLIARPAA